MIKSWPKLKIWRPTSLLITAFAMLLGAVMPAVLPYFKEKVSAAGTSTNMVYGNPDGLPDGSTLTGQVSQATTCVGSYSQQVLNSAIISKALGPGFENFEQWAGKPDSDLRAHFYSQPLNTIGGFGDFRNPNSSLGKINEQVGMNYLRWMRDHIGQQVNVILFSSPAGTSITPSCGTLSNPNDYQSARFISVPVEGDPANPYAFIGRQIYVGFRAQTSITHGGVMRFAVPAPAGEDTSGELDFYDQGGNYVENRRVNITGRPKLVGPILTGTVTGATFQDAANIVIQYQLSGQTFHETYTDYKWDNLNYYFLSQTDQPSRENITVSQKTGEDTSRDPIAQHGTIPFIKANGPAYNLSYTGRSDQDALNAMRSGVNGLGTSGLVFYDYDLNGGIGTGQDGLPTPVTIPAVNSQNSTVWFYTNGRDGFVDVFGNANPNEAHFRGLYALNSGTQNPTYYDHNAGGCAYLGRIKTASGAPLAGATDTVININWTLHRENKGCQPLGGMGTLDVKAIANAQLYDAAASAAANPSAGTPAQAQFTCETSLIAIGWLICPIALAIVSLVSSLENTILDLLTIDVNKYLNEDSQTAGDPGPALYKAWNSIRILSMAIITIAALIMVIAQALGFEVMNAYAIKKTLPRLLIAVALITITWPLAKALITGSATLMYGLMAILYAPFSEMASFRVGLDQTLLATILGGAAFLALGPMGLLSFAGTALIAVGLAFLFLEGWVMLTIVLVVTSSLWIALGILDATRPASSFARKATIGVLIFGPAAALCIVVGDIFAIISYNANSGSLWGSVLAVGFKSAGLIAVIFLPSLIGGLMASVANMLRGRSGNLFGGLSRYRQNQVNENFGKMARGERFNLGGANNPFNQATRAVGTFANSKRKWGFLTDSNVRQAAFNEQTAMDRAKYGQTPEAQAQKDNDLVNQALTFGGEQEARAGLASRFRKMNYSNDATGRANMEAAIAGVKANGGWSAAKQDYAARALAHTKTGYGDLWDVQRTVYGIAGSNTGLAASLLGEINAVSGNGREDLKPGYGDQMGIYQDMVDNGGTLNDFKVHTAVAKGMQDADAGTMLRAKHGAIENGAASTSFLFDHYDRIRKDPSSKPADIIEANNKLQEITTTAEKIEQFFPYASTSAQGIAGQQLVQPTAEVRREIRMRESPVKTSVNPTTNKPEVNYLTRTDPSTGQEQVIVDPKTNRPVPIPNPVTSAEDARLRQRAEVFNTTASRGDPRNEGHI